MAKRWLQRAQPLLILLSLLLIGWLLRTQWTELRAYPWRLHGGWLLLSALFMASTWFVEVSLWRRVLALVGGQLPFRAAWRIWFLSALVRYVPGSIWQPLSMAVYSQQQGVRPEATLMSMVLYQVVTLLAVIPLAAVYVLIGPNQSLLLDLLAGATPWLLALGALGIFAFLLRPAWLLRMVNWALRKAGRATLSVQLSTADLLGLLLIAIMSWLLWGISFAALTFSLRAYPSTEVFALALPLIMVFAVGYAAGVLSLITPSGFGVREGAYYLLLVPLVDGGTVTVAALAMRVWTMLGEVLMAGVSLLGKPQPAVATEPPADEPVTYGPVYSPTPEAPVE
jgi:hypothetical protein